MSAAPRGPARRFRRMLIRGLLGLSFLGLLSGLVALRLHDPFAFEVARGTGFDLMQRLAPRVPQVASVRIVAIDEASLDAFGQWPWPRDRLALMVERLTAAGAAAIAFDVIFAEADRLSPARLMSDPELARRLRPGEPLPDTDEAFAAAIGQSYVVLGFGSAPDAGAAPPVKAGFAQTGGDARGALPVFAGATAPIPVLAEAASGVGSVSLSSDAAYGVVREVPLLWTDGEQIYPGLAAEALRVAQDARTFVVHAAPDTGNVAALRIGEFEVPTTPEGAITIHYARPDPARYISAVDIFDDEKLTAALPEIQGHIVFVGATAVGLHDIRKTSLGDTVPGVEMHAQAIEQIVNGQYIIRHDWTRGAEILAFLGSASAIGLAMAFSGAGMALILGAIGASLVALWCWVAYQQHGILIDVSFPLFGTGLVWFVATIFRFLLADRDRRAIRGAFRYYVDDNVLRQIEKNYRSLSLGGEDRDLTVMFTDVRGFTALSERMAPQRLIGFLNVLLGRQSAAIRAEGGTIDKFIGDSVMAFWNAPIDQPDHAARACRAALALRIEVAKMNAAAGELLGEVAERVEIGIGVNTGRACVGNIGSSERFDYSAVGDAVNQAARTESACKTLGYDIAVTASTAAEASGFAFLPAGRMAMKGRREEVEILILLGGPELRESPGFRELSSRYGRLLDALREGRDAEIDPLMQDCRALAALIDPRLLGFLDRLPTRRRDFQKGRARVRLVPADGQSA